MKISKLTAHNFRSLKNVEIDLSNYTVLIGQNNIGKSNILRAMESFFLLLKKIKIGPGALKRSKPLLGLPVSEERDFPVDSKATVKHTKIQVEFKLEDSDFSLSIFDEQELFLPTDIPKTITATLRIDFNNNLYGFDFDMPNNQHHLLFLRFIKKNFKFVRVNSNRSFLISDENSSLHSFSANVFNNLEGSYSINKSLALLQDRANKELKRASTKLKANIKKFIPSIKKIEFQLNMLGDISEMLSIRDIVIDDGKSTSILNKGDGIQSLFSLGLIHYLVSKRGPGNLFIGIDEPEAHLHPEAQEGLLNLLHEISKSDQILLTTHSPIFIERAQANCNIVIPSNGVPKYSKSLKEIRRVLGVKVYHNLENAEILVLVEGESDKTIIEGLASKIGKEFCLGIKSGKILVMNCGGVDNIPGHLRYNNSIMQKSVVLVDNDREGQNVALQAQKLFAETFIIPLKSGAQDSEIEDAFPVGHTLLALKNAFSIDIDEATFNKTYRQTGGAKTKPRKWSVVAARILNEKGIPTIDDSSLNLLKAEFASVSVRHDNVPDFLKTLATNVLKVLTVSRDRIAA